MEYKASKAVGKNIAALRKQREMTQAELAKLSGISESSVNNIEVGRRGNISMSSLEAIAEALKVNMWELFYECDHDKYLDMTDELIKREERVKKAFYPPMCEDYPISSLMEFLIYAPLMDWKCLADSVARIEGCHYSSEDYVFKQMAFLVADIEDGPALRYAHKLHEYYNLSRAGACMTDSFKADFIEQVDNGYKDYKFACLEKLNHR